LISDRRIIERVLKGYTDEYAGLMQRHQDAVFRLAYGILGRREEAEDAVQEIFVKAYSNLAECRERDRFRQWIRRIALNTCLRRIPREYPSEGVGEMLDAASELGNPVEAETLRRAEVAAVRRAVGCLPAMYRIVLALRYDEDLPYSEIAELIGESTDVVRTRLHRAKKMLAERLAVVTDEV